MYIDIDIDDQQEESLEYVRLLPERTPRSEKRRCYQGNLFSRNQQEAGTVSKIQLRYMTV